MELTAINASTFNNRGDFSAVIGNSNQIFVILYNSFVGMHKIDLIAIFQSLCKL